MPNTISNSQVVGAATAPETGAPDNTGDIAGQRGSAGCEVQRLHFCRACEDAAAVGPAVIGQGVWCQLGGVRAAGGVHTRAFCKRQHACHARMTGACKGCPAKLALRGGAIIVHCSRGAFAAHGTRWRAHGKHGGGGRRVES